MKVLILVTELSRIGLDERFSFHDRKENTHLDATSEMNDETQGKAIQLEVELLNKDKRESSRSV